MPAIDYLAPTGTNRARFAATRLLHARVKPALVNEGDPHLLGHCQARRAGTSWLFASNTGAALHRAAWPTIKTRP